MEYEESFDFSKLDIAERILLAQSLWDSVLPNADDVAVTDEQKRELDSRLQAEADGVLSQSSWAETKQRIQPEE